MLDIPKAASRLRQMAKDGMHRGQEPARTGDDTARARGDAVNAPNPTIVRLPEGTPVARPDDRSVARPGVRRMRPGFELPAGGLKLSTGGVIRLTFLLFVLLPTIATGIYFAFFAADQYSVEAQFAVRSKETTGASIDGLTILSGMTGSAPNASDSYVVINFAQSRDLVGKIDKDLDLRKLYSRPEADFFAAVDPEAPVEDLVEYWNGMVTETYDKYSGIVTLQVKAFRAQDAVAVAQKVIGYSEALVNDLSRRARDDAVAESESEVARAENRLRLARRAVANFRGNERRLNPMATAESREKIIGELEAEKSKLETELSAVKQVSPNSPRLTSLNSQLAAIIKQIDSVRLQTNQNESGDEGTLNQQLSQYEELQTEREFAEKAYISSLASLEKARLEATSQSRYLSVFVEPRLPDIALYPEGLRSTVIVFIGAFLIWAIGGLIVAGVRDHVA